MIRKLIAVIIVLAIIAAIVGWVLTSPKTLAASDLPNHTPDLANGAFMFHAGGCDSCHADRAARGEDRLKLGGGLVLESPVGKFHVPNISPDPQHGIGNWTTLQFVNAMKMGVAPDGAHLYPAFPYYSYQRMKLEDIIDLKAYLDTLPPVAVSVPPHELLFPFSIRRGLGAWKLLYIDGKTFEPDPAASAEVNTGAYLVIAPGHCGECHSPRGITQAIDESRALSGAPSPDGKGWIPNITPDVKTGIGALSHEDIVTVLTGGLSPLTFDSLGGEMAQVTRELKAADEMRPGTVAAIATYLQSLPPIVNAAPARPGPGS
jgi:mono/diheme cytochrome c family protein